MCEACSKRIEGWQGWPDFADDTGICGSGPWQDLSHVLTEDLARAPAFPKPRISRLRTIPQDPVNITMIEMSCHHGTHIDAPRHFFNDGPAFEDIALPRLCGRGVVWRIRKGPHAPLTADDFEAARPKLRRGDMVFIDTGWAERIADSDYEDHAFLTEEAAWWLVHQGAKLLAIDFSSPEIAAHRRPEGFDFPIHRILLGHGVLIAEHVTNYATLAGQTVEAMFAAISIAGSDGGLTRAIARPLQAGNDVA